MPAPPVVPVVAEDPLGELVAEELPVPEEGIPEPPVPAALALVTAGPARANTAKLGRIRWVTRKRSLSSAYGVS
jgi:hypothetical protein